tara:strand:+ start:1278 stop:1718 length:441 start_codon:yes stop_codon:yes gene_type:complete
MKVLSSSSNIASDQLLEGFKKSKKNKEPIFVFFYMEGCGPCNATRPEWDKIKEDKSVQNKKFTIADFEFTFIEKLNIGITPSGFPAMYYIKGKSIEKYEDSGISIKDRTSESFVLWIKSKLRKKRKTKKKKTKHSKKIISSRRTNE